MKTFRLFILILTGSGLFFACGKPKDAATILPDDISGGYSIVKKFATPGYSQDVLKRGNLLYMAQGEGGLLIVDVTDPVNPEIVSVTTEGVRGYSTKISVKDSAAYLAAGSFGVNVLLIADPSMPVVTVSNSDMKPAKDLHVFGDYLLTAVSEQGVRVSDISFPIVPDPRGGVETDGYAQGMVTSSDSAFLYVACGEMGMAVYDISDFQNGFGIYPKVGWCDTPGYAEAVTLQEENTLAFLACGTAGLQILNYADTNNIHIVGSFDASGYAKEIVWKDKKVYLTTELSGLQVIDVSDPANPNLVGIVNTEYALGLYVDEDYIYVADEVEGLIIISFPQ